MTDQDFGLLLTKGIRYICARENKPVGVVQDELGYAVNHNGSSAIRYWRQGHCPSNPAHVKQLARLIVQRGGMDHAWLEQFLHSAGFPGAAELCDEIFPGQRQ